MCLLTIAADVQDSKYKTYQDYMFAQLKELLNNYGDIRMLWFDNYWFVSGQWKNDPEHAPELYAYVRSLSPNVLVNDRCGRAGFEIQDLPGLYVCPVEGTAKQLRRHPDVVVRQLLVCERPMEKRSGTRPGTLRLCSFPESKCAC